MLTVELTSSVPSDLDARFRIALEEKFSQVSRRLYDKVIENLSGKILQPKTGQLLGSIRQETDVSGDVMMTIIGPSPETPKAWALEMGGEKNYAIFPTKARVLRFYWDKVGRVVFFPYVDHPPSREFAYLRSALDEMHSVAIEEMRATAVEVLGE